MATPIESLPEELLVQILSYLNESPAPSETKIRDEPSIRLTVSEDRDFKNVSVVSRKWRRLTLPLLFTHLRMRLDDAPRKHWAICSVCTEASVDIRLQTGDSPPSSTTTAHQYHMDMMEDAACKITEAKVSGRKTAGASLLGNQASAASYKNFLTWAPRFYHSLCDLCGFLEANELFSGVQSIVVMTGNMLPEKLDRYPHRAATDTDWRYKAAAAFWQHLMSVMSPSRVVILAPPVDLACLTNCAIDTEGDWAFRDMNYHILELGMERDQLLTSTALQPDVSYSSLEYMPFRCPGIAKSSILKLRPWSHIGINEGAFLKAYGTYEYFERGPPSLIYSIKDSLSPRPIFSPHARISYTPLASLRSLSYTAIFPFANHLDFRELLPQLEELDVQLAPAPTSNILNDKDRVGKAELEDCWSELMSIYQNLASQLASFRVSERNMPCLKKLICRDCKIPALQSELDEVFIPLCLPVWAEYEPGVFVRLAMSAAAHMADAAT